MALIDYSDPRQRYRARGYTVIIQAIIVAVMLAASYYLSKNAQKRNKKDLGDDQPTTTATRGDWIPLIIGLRRVGCVVGAIPPESRKEIQVDGPGNNAVGEDAWHLIACGPGDEIHRIFANNEVIWDQKISRSDTPSGTTFQLDNEKGSFTVYWGEDNQPVCLPLSSYLGHKSCHPKLMYIWWTQYNLGSTPVWPQIEYVVRVTCPFATLKNSDYMLNTDGVRAKGVNLAHAILQILCAPKPHGMGLPLDLIDNETLEHFGVVMQSEGIGINVVISDGQKGSEVLQNLLIDAGASISQVNGRYYFTMQRDTEDPIPVLTNDVVMPPDFERTINHGESQASETQFTFKNEDSYSYRDMDVQFPDDSQFNETGNTKQATTQITSVTNGVPATKIASRRWQETASRAAFSFAGIRGLRRLVPGAVLSHPDLGRLLVTNVTPKDLVPEAKIDVTPDVYGIEAVGESYTPPSTPQLPDDPDPLPPAPGRNVAADTGFNWFELPSDLAGGQLSIVVFRLRSNASIRGAAIMAAVDGGAYAKVGNQDVSGAGGFIDNVIPASTPDVIVYGPTFEDVNGDAAKILDLSGDLASWQSGVQVACINDEVFYLQSVTVQAESVWVAGATYTAGMFVVPPTGGSLFRFKCITGGTAGATEPVWSFGKNEIVTDGTVTWEAHFFSYRLNNLIRAKYGTTKAPHTAGQRVIVAKQSDLVRITAPSFAPGSNLCIKTFPFTATQTATSGVEYCKTITGKYNQPAIGTFATTEDGLIFETETGELLDFDEG